MAKGDCVELSFVDLSYGGRAVGRHDGMAVFVPRCLPGERARVRITKQKKRFAEAELVELLEAAPERCEPSCPLADICPGCDYQHVHYETELLYKKKQLDSLMQRLGKQEALPPGDVFGAEKVLGYRNKLNMQCDGHAVGYRCPDRSLLDVASCPLASDGINVVLAEWRASGGHLSGGFRRVLMRDTEKDGARLWDPAEEAEAAVLHEVGLAGELTLPANAFFQVNPTSSLKLQKQLLKRMNFSEAMTIDLYCGVGLFALLAAANGGRSVLGIEMHREAVIAARANAKALGLQARFESQPVAKAFKSIASAVGGSPFQVVVDPPRQGMDAATRSQLLDLGPQKVAYISCSADTQARDIAAFCEAGYQLTSLDLVDMFPRTAHFEALAVLER